MKKNKKLKLFSLIFLSLFVLLCQTIVYSAINSTITIKGEAYARVDADVRITKFSINDTTNNSISMYENYSKNTITSEVKLKENSSITYNIEITNFGLTDVGIYSISGLPDGVYYSIENYNLKEKMCQTDNKCNNNAVMNYKLKIYTTNISYEGPINLYFDFRVFHNISYVGFSGNYINEIMDGDSINISFSNENIDFPSVKSQSTIFNKYESKNLYLSNVINNVEIIAVNNSVKEFNYTGSEQVFVAPYSGIYKIEAWGGQGGSAGESIGGYGGYSTGFINLNSGDTLYINVGGAAPKTETYNECTSGGYNGGGSTCSIDDAYFGSGGGATHIATKSGLLESLSNYKSNVLIVAGGGGGAGFYNGTETEYSVINNGGSGGGAIANDGQGRGIGKGANQNSIGNTNTQSNGTDGSFGRGGSGSTAGGSGGGAGLYGGGVGYAYGSSAGGGSGSISNKKIITGHMVCYNCEPSNGIDSKTYSSSIASSSPVSSTPKIGNGHVKITYVDEIKNDELYISYIEFDNQNSTENSYKIDDIKNLTINSNIFLNNNNSKIYLKTKIKNSSNETYTYAGTTKNKYSNNDITYEITGLSNGQQINPNEEVELTLIFSYLDPASITNKYLECNLTFNFIVSSYITEYEAIDEIRELNIKYSGIYKLEAWGAQGGGVYQSRIGGAGAYSVGYIELNKNEILSVVVGGAGKYSNKFNECNSGGFNGGGNACAVADAHFASGGGATHIATTTGLLSTLANQKDSILIIAGGGGGAANYEGEVEEYNTEYRGGGCGGGFQGQTGIGYDYGNAGTQSSGGYGSIAVGSFGQGGSITQYGTAASGGGGGLYGGGTGYGYGSSAGGGSGYIGNSRLYNKYMVCYNCGVSNDANTKTTQHGKISLKATPDIPKEGNGYAKITLIELK